MKENKYGYKVCYNKKNKRKLHIYMVTETLDSAIWQKKWCERNVKINNANWKIIAIKNNIEYKKLWRGCPFRMASSN